MNYLKKLWSSLPEKYRKEITSFSHTFFGTMILFIGIQLSSGQIEWKQEALMALAISAIRAAWKAAYNAVFLQPATSETAQASQPTTNP